MVIIILPSLQNAILFFLHHFELNGHNQAVENPIQLANFQQQHRMQPQRLPLELQLQNEGQNVGRTVMRTREDQEDREISQRAEHRSPVEESRTSLLTVLLDFTP
jgi:hypothetical protein